MNNSTLIVENPEIPIVMDTETGDFHTLSEVVGVEREKAIQRRMAIKEGQIQGQPLYICAECFVPVTLLIHPKYSRFHFKHTLEDGRCSAVTRGELSQKEINARRYNGAKESAKHLRMKALVIQSLEADSRFSHILPEKRWTGEVNGQWRQPDVQAVYDPLDESGPIKVAFEIQLSTTYLDVIAERRVFYRNEGALVFWIFAEFNESDRRLMQDDVFYNNNLNAFLVNEETTRRSKERSEFHLNCAWVEPNISTEVLSFQRKTVSFRDLILDKGNQQVYYFDFNGAKKALVKTETEKELATYSQLRDDFEKFWLARAEPGLEDIKIWKQLRGRFRKAGLELPEYANHLPVPLIDILYSVKHGRAIGWDYPTLVQVGHWVVAKYPQFLQYFRKAAFVYERGAQLEAEDKTGNWRHKALKYKKAIKASDPKYAQDTAHDELVKFLYPELVDESGRIF